MSRRTYVLVVQAVVVLSSPAWVYWLFFGHPYEYQSAIILVPIICAFDIALILHLTRNNRRLQHIMLVGLAAKMAATGLYIFYFGMAGADTTTYYRAGRKIAESFDATGSWSHATTVVGTEAISQLIALLIEVIGPSFSTFSVIFASIAFWGCYLYYRTFLISLPNGDRGLLAILLFLFPSSVLWTAAIGKDAVIAFSLALAFYGCARLARNAGVRGVMLIGAGLVGVLLIRPHIALMMIVAIVTAYGFGRARGGITGALVKFVALPIIVLFSYYTLFQTQEFLGANDLGVGAKRFEMVQRNTSIGNSVVATGFVYAPVLFFRPLPWEISSPSLAVTGAEGILLLVFVFLRRSSLIVSIKEHWRSPVVLAILLFVAGFCIVFSGTIGNLGILARQRVMVLPPFFILLCAKVQTARDRGPIRASEIVTEEALSGAPCSESIRRLNGIRQRGFPGTV
jgi:hypothetical protein